MKKMIYTKPLAEVMDFTAEDILRTSTNKTDYDGGTVTAYSDTNSKITLSGTDLVIN